MLVVSFSAIAASSSNPAAPTSTRTGGNATSGVEALLINLGEKKGKGTMTNLKHPILVGLLLLVGGFGLAYILGNILYLPFSSPGNEILKFIPVTIAVVGGVTIFLHFVRDKK